MFSSYISFFGTFLGLASEIIRFSSWNRSQDCPFKHNKLVFCWAVGFDQAFPESTEGA